MHLGSIAYLKNCYLNKDFFFLSNSNHGNAPAHPTFSFKYKGNIFSFEPNALWQSIMKLLYAIDYRHD